MPPAPLHWMIADQERCLVAEMVEEGLKLYDDPAGVLTNNPPFPFHQMNLHNYLNLTADAPKNRFAKGVELETYGQGMGALGLPGDASPASRFVRAAFLKWNAKSEKEESANVSQFFHILDGVAMVRGMVMTPEGKCDITTYSSCMNGEKGIYYYKTYENNRIRAVDMHREDLDGTQLKVWEIGGTQDILREIITELTGRISLLQSTARNVAYLDVMLSFAKVAKENNYVKPTISRDLSTTIEDGRHPVVEQLMKKNEFVPNNAYLDCGQDRLMIITGPNMSGKSTYMRQIALITLMAHIGSFVPAKKADIALADRIFTRIGASDDLSYGQSTFMVEMVEVAEILHNATMNSLVIMDEIGRGTSTLDGLSIAVAVAEDIAKRIRCKTLFSTHYHEMTALEDRVEGAKNYKVTAAENKNTVIFLHKVMRGGANKSFGIEVAQLAGLPKSVTNRAKALSKQLEKSPLKLEDNSDEMNLITISENNTLRDRLKEIDMDVMTPMQAFGTLNELVDIAKKM